MNSKNEIRSVVFVCPHKTLGDSVILRRVFLEIVKNNPSLEFTIYADVGLKELWSCLKLQNVDLVFVDVSLWPKNGNRFLNIYLRKYHLLKLFLLVWLKYHNSFEDLLVLGPDWFNNYSANLDLFDSNLTRFFSMQYIPNIFDRTILRNRFKSQYMSHAEMIRNELKMVGLVPEAKDANVAVAISGSVSERSPKLEAVNASFPDHILIIGGAGDARRDWTGHYGVRLRQWLSEQLFISVRFISQDEVLFLGIDKMFSLIRRAKFIVANDTGWFHVAADLDIPALCVSPIKNEFTDRYVQKSDRILVMRPKGLLFPCMDFCIAETFHCLHQLCVFDVGKQVYDYFGFNHSLDTKGL